MRYVITRSTAAYLLKAIDTLHFKNLLSVIRYFGKHSLELYITHLLLFFILSAYTVLDMTHRHTMMIAIVLSIIIAKPINLIIEKVNSFLWK